MVGAAGGLLTSYPKTAIVFFVAGAVVFVRAFFKREKNSNEPTTSVRTGDNKVGDSRSGGNTPANNKLLLFDQQTQKWTVLLDSTTAGVSQPNWPQWSGNGRFVYFETIGSGGQKYALYRIAVADHKLERVAEIDVPEGTTGTWGPWMGITPDGSPLLLRNRSFQEVYALDVDLP